MIAAVVGASIVYLALSPTAALLLGRVIRYRERQVPR